MGKAKKSKGKTSAVKIGNKRLNKLSKQGKLRKQPNKRKRQEKLSASSQKAAHKNEERQEIIEEELPLQEDDISFYGTPGQNLSFTSSIRDRFVNTFQINGIFHKATYNKVRMVQYIQGCGNTMLDLSNWYIFIQDKLKISIYLSLDKCK